MKKVALHNLGCKVNAYETEAMQELLEKHGYEIVPFQEGADVYIINTCTVTNMADRKSRQMLHKAKKMNPEAIVVATGCYVQTGGEKLEKDEAIDLLEQNKRKFGTDNLEIIKGLAPEALEGLPAPTHAFIGGSSGNLKEILEVLLEQNPRVRVVINAIALETVAEAMQCLKSMAFTDVDIAQVSVAKGKKLGSYEMMMGQNPVYIFSCTGGETA